MEELSRMVIDWMNANDKLAGWAQFGGATLALVVAIWVPWYQAGIAEKAVRAARIERELSNVQGVFFLLTNIVIWLTSAGDRGNLPRKLFSDDPEVHDLLERIRLWEGREECEDRITALFLARGALIRAQQTLSFVFLEDQPVSEVERVRIQKNVEEIRKSIAAVQRQRHDAHRARNLNRTIWLLKPIAILTWTLFPHKDDEDCPKGAKS